MKTFQEKELHAAYDYAAAGGQALHLMSGRYAYIRKDTPACFKGRATIAHLFDRDKARLEKTARFLGVRVIKVERAGERGQHIDLCGKPLSRAEDLVRKAVLFATATPAETTRAVHEAFVNRPG